jgi:hypothetical protein
LGTTTRGDRKAALQERFAVEERERADPDIEVVLLSAPSRDALVHTHARYFQRAGEILARHVPEN